MSGQAIPPPFESLMHRPFSFYPPILDVEHNEWRFRRATWSEILVVNTKSGDEIWIPRRFIGEISRIDEPVMILGLTKELEYKSGQVLPHTRRVIEIPRAVNDIEVPRSAPTPQPAPVVGIRLESGTESRIGRLIVAALTFGTIGCVLIISFLQSGRDGSRVKYAPVLQSELKLTGQDDYYAVKRELGEPAQEQWRSNEGEMQYRILRYPDKDLAVILMGAERNKELYIGALDLKSLRPVHVVSLPDGRDTRSMLRSLRQALSSDHGK
jgi:hypothetical protein